MRPSTPSELAAGYLCLAELVAIGLQTPSHPRNGSVWAAGRHGAYGVHAVVVLMEGVLHDERPPDTYGADDGQS